MFGRYFDSGARSIQVHFTFRGVRCRETLPGLDPDVRNHVKHAENILGSIRRDIGNGTFNYLEYFPESKRARLFGHAVSQRTVRQICESWLEDMKRSLPHSTYRMYAGVCARFVLPAIGDLRVRDVTVEHLRQMFRGLDVTLKTARNYSIPVRAIFERALKDDDIERNPMDRLNVKEYVAREKHRSTYDVDPLDVAEQRAFLEACRIHRQAWLNYFETAFGSGLRTSELYGLEWADVDFDARVIHVRRAVVEREVKDPKTESSERTIDMEESVYLALKRQRRARGLAGGRVFVNPRTGKTLADYEVTSRAWYYCIGKAGIRRRNQYQTRHTYASQRLSAGGNPAYIARQLGHRGLQMLFRTYGRWVSGETPATQISGQNVT